MQSVELPSDFVSAYCFSYRYDKAGNVIEQHTPGGFYEQMLYDNQQRLWRRWDGAQNDYWGHKYVEEYSYDSLNRLKDLSVLVMSTDSELSSEEDVVSSSPMMSYGYDNYEGVPTALAYDGGDYLAEPRGLKTYEKLLLMESNTQIGIMIYYAERAFYYDDKGRLKRMVERNHRDGVSHIDYQYDFCGNTIQRTEYIQPMANMPVDTLTVQYTYDHAGRLLSETTTLNSSDPVTVDFSYNELGQLVGQSDNGEISETYEYNLQGWISNYQAIKPGNENPLFRYSLRYYDPRYNEQKSYTGGISEWEWQHQNDVQQTYTFTYDSFARMIDNRHYHGAMLRDGYAERNITYDRNGNIKTLKRYTTGNSGVDFTYTYEGGRLKSVQGKEYTYDHCGNVAHEGLEDLDITYNFLNLPWQIIRNRTKERIIYSYLSDGKKVLSVDPNGHGLLYVGSLVYNHLDWYTPELESAPFSGGRIEVSEGQNGKVYTPYYYVTDHLGSVRAVVADGEVLDKCDYYPFGKKWITPESGAPRSRYCYNGKEQQWAGMSGLLDYGARFYNPNIGRWLSIDPLAVKYANITSYAYLGNNPIRRIDPNGEEWVDANGNLMWENGGYTKYATADFKRMGNAMMQDAIGLDQLNDVANLPTKVQVEISPDAPEGLRGRVALSLKHPYGDHTKGNIYATKALVIIYEGSIRAEVEGFMSQTTIPSTGAIHDSIVLMTKMMQGESCEEIVNTVVEIVLGSVGVHECVHLLPENIALLIEAEKYKEEKGYNEEIYKNKRDQLEDAPLKRQGLFLHQIMLQTVYGN